MDLSNLKPKTLRKSSKRVGRGGKRGTTSGHGTKGQKGRAGSSVKPGFRGGDNRIWQLFPKQRGASKKPGGKGIHVKHRFYMLRHSKSTVLNLGDLNGVLFRSDPEQREVTGGVFGGYDMPNGYGRLHFCGLAGGCSMTCVNRSNLCLHVLELLYRHHPRPSTGRSER